jgi:predicted SAM-dependent methyltransferase
MLDLKNYSHIDLKIIIGAGEQSYDGWIATHKDQLNLTNEADWQKSFETRKADAFLCEHVWEHLTLEEGKKAAKLIFNSLKPGGYIRVAVPDANFPDKEYQKTVQIGGPGPVDHPAADHKIVYDYKTLRAIFAEAGFQVDLLEFCDEFGRFHYNQWDLSKGIIYRSLMIDHRNKNGLIGFASLIIDALRPYP